MEDMGMDGVDSVAFRHGGGKKSENEGLSGHRRGIPPKEELPPPNDIVEKTDDIFEAANNLGIDLTGGVDLEPEQPSGEGLSLAVDRKTPGETFDPAGAAREAIEEPVMPAQPQPPMMETPQTHKEAQKPTVEGDDEGSTPPKNEESVNDGEPLSPAEEAVINAYKNAIAGGGEVPPALKIQYETIIGENDTGKPEEPQTTERGASRDQEELAETTRLNAVENEPLTEQQETNEAKRLDAIEIEKAANEKIETDPMGKELLDYVNSQKQEMANNAPIGKWEKVKFFLRMGGPKGDAFQEAKSNLKKTESFLEVWKAKEGEYIVSAEDITENIQKFLAISEDPSAGKFEKRSLRRQIQKQNVKLHKKRNMMEDRLLPDVKETLGLKSDFNKESMLSGLPSSKAIMNDYEQKAAFLGELGAENAARKSDFHDLSIQILEKSLESGQLNLEVVETMRGAVAEYIRDGKVSPETIEAIKAEFNIPENLKNAALDEYEISRLCAKAWVPMFKLILGGTEKLSDANLEKFFKEQGAKSIRVYSEKIKEQLLLENLLRSESVDPRTFSARKAYQAMEMVLKNERSVKASRLGVKFEMKKAVFSQLMNDSFDVVKKNMKQSLGDMVGAKTEIDADTKLREIMDEGENTIAAAYQVIRTITAAANPKVMGTLTSPVFAGEGKILTGTEAITGLFGESEKLALWRVSYERRRNNSARRVRERAEILTDAAMALAGVVARGYEGGITEALVTRGGGITRASLESISAKGGGLIDKIKRRIGENH